MARLQIMRFFFAALVAALLHTVAATAQPSLPEDPPARPCGFHSPNAAAARTFLITNFDTLRFLAGERIADIGAQSGNLAGIFSLFYDNLDMTLEDIDSSCLNPAQLRATLRYYYGIRERESPKNFKTRIVIGTEISTGLPDAAYTKVFFMNTYHEVAEKGPILAELHRITAPGGMLYVSEKVSTTKVVKRRDCGHGTPIERDLLKAFADAGFQLLKTIEIDRYRRKGDWLRHCCFHFRKK